MQYTESLKQQQYTEHILIRKYYKELRPTLVIPIPRYANQRIKQVISVHLKTGHSLLASSLHNRHLPQVDSASVENKTYNTSY